MARKFVGGCLGLVVAVVVAGALLPEVEDSADESAGSASAASSAGAGAGKPTSPAKAPAVWKASFTTLPQGHWTAASTHSMVDMGLVDDASLRLAAEFNAAPFPKHDCELPDGGGTAVGLEAVGSTYANCLMEAWQPWLDAHGAAQLEPVVVRHCANPVHTREQGCKDPDEFLGRATQDHIIYLAPSATLQRRTRHDIEAVIAHEVGHHLQYQVTPLKGGERVLTMGVADPDPLRQSRRSELQVECLSIGMMAASSRSGDVMGWALDHVYDSSATHWDRTRHEFWVRQAGKGHAGDCNANLAADSLLAHQAPAKGR